MESLERKDASTGPEEPIKSEGMVPSPNTSERSNNAASPPPNCSICLGKLINTSFTDSCLHQFCFTCLLQWSKIKTECPLCKQTFKSIIHNVRSEEDYDQYHVQYTSQVAATLDVTADIHINGQWDIHGIDVPRPFMYRTTMGAHAHRRYGMLLNPEAVARREQIPSITPQVSIEERRRRHANPIDFRRTVYRHGVWAASLPDAFGRFRESSAEFYRRHHSQVLRLVPWLNRELQVLLNNNRPQIAYVMGVITDTLTQYDIRSDEFRNTVRPYFGIHTDHFVHELSNYARTNFDLIGYDQAVNYISSNRGLSNEYVHRAISPTPSTSSSSSNDSDVCVLADSNDRFDMNRLSYVPSVGPHMIDAPGPSTVGQAFRIQLPPMIPDVLTISSTSSSSENECEVIGYVKPRHERTPEIIDLSSSDGENRSASNATSNDNTQAEALIPYKEENLPSTSSSGDVNSVNCRTRRRTDDLAAVQMYNYLDSTSESDSAENDSDYNPNSRKSRRYKTNVSKKSSKAVPRKVRSRKRKKSVSNKRKRGKAIQSRTFYSSGDDSDNESPQRGISSSRGIKRYLSNKSSDASEIENVSKKKKKSKKTTLPNKTKKSRVTSSSSSKTAPVPSYEYSSSCSNSFDESESENTKIKLSNCRRTRKPSATTNSHDYTSEEQTDNEKSSSKSGSTRSTRQESKASSKIGDSDLSDYRRSGSSRHSSIGSSYDRRKAADKLQNNENNRRNFTSEEEMISSHGSTCSDNDSGSTGPKRKLSSSKSTVVTTTTNSEQTTSQSSEKSTASSSNSSSKSDMSSPTEHSSPSKSSKDRHRSHKKRKESKKRRRSHS